MKNFIVAISLLGMLSSCTYNSYTVKDEMVKDVKQNEVKQDEKQTNMKKARAEMIKVCKEDNTICSFSRQNDIDHLILLFQNEKAMGTIKNDIAAIGSGFCISSNVLLIPSQFHIALREERLVRDFDCLTSTWNEWYAFEKQSSGRY